MLLGTEQQRKDRVEKVTGESLGELLWFLRKIMDRKGLSWGGAAFIYLEVRKGGPGDRSWGLVWVRLCCPLLPGLHVSLGPRTFRGNKRFMP